MNKQTFIYHRVYRYIMKKKINKVYLGDLPENGLSQKIVDEIVRRFTEAREKRKK